MFEGWENFFLIVGPSAGALIGLMFVVVTLSPGRNPQQVEMGKHLYTSPVVWHLSVVLLLSGAAVAPPMPRTAFGAIVTLLALLGIGFGLRSAFGIAKHRLSGADSMFDMWFYGIIPAIAYLCLTASGIALMIDGRWAEAAFGASLMGLLLVSIHAEWDLVTFLAPRANDTTK